MPEIDNVQAILNAGRATASSALAVPAGYKPAVVVPDSYTLEPLEFSEPLPLPDFIVSQVTLYEADSFVQYSNRYKNPNTLVFASPAQQVLKGNASIEARFDYHAQSSPMRNRHGARYQLTLSTELAEWMAIDGVGQNQEQFARFLDDRLQDVIHPDGAVLIALAEGLEAKTKVNFQSRINRKSGARVLVHDENIDLKIGAGQIDVPDGLKLYIPVFEGGKRQPIEARLPIRITEGRLYITTHLLKLADVARDALAEVTKHIAEETELLILCGMEGPGH
jgi:uncharacterized protein YfdQ (DUF2303 family)